MLVRASRGELHAVEAIAVLYGPALAYEAGEPASFALVSQFADALMDAVPRHRLPRAVAMRWMSGVLDVVAHRHRRQRADNRESEGRDP